ncbi:hypothetical protein [Candidatus Nitronereus thalassa]|uniref:Uncharacterized protein n=1 Tax=Candidatus Nitronereus thalassa TaxID=3020898 RepID=A0ABU3KBC0_9BACT|nr:hypothetical protein [Candidatus Nitronereus thalassa]MDT7043524.1 hypothetical protein [Candidatus Nitronereus thalassa]
MNTSSKLTPHSYLLALIPPLLILGLAQLLFEITSAPSMTGVTTALERLAHQNPESLDIRVLQEGRGRYAWLAMALLSLVAFVYGTVAGCQIIWHSHFRSRLPLILSIGTVLMGIGILGLIYQVQSEAAMYRLIFGFTFTTFSHSGLFHPQFLSNVKFILLILNTFAVIVPAIIILAASSALATPPDKSPSTLDTLSTQMHQLRNTLNIGSIALVAGILHMHAWLQWPASLFQDASFQSAASNTALAITVFWGTSFTLMLMATYGPAATTLSAQARHILQRDHHEGRIHDPQAWLKDHDLSITLGEQLPQIGIMLAPVLAGPLGSLVMGSN